MMKFKNLIIFYVFLDAVLILVMAAFGYIYLLNSQVAFICSTLILFTSYYGYKKRIDEKSINYQLSAQEKSFFDDNEEDDNDLDIKEIKKKAKFKKMDIIGAFKPYRLLGYITLILAFFMLLRRELFEPFSFLLGLVLMPLGVFLAGVFTRDK
ncbi:hypothetical protein CFTD6683_06575 [Campylobacter fetus subsp. testudinum]|uniref:Integral membrane protein n=3 Tax=Campylobacter fetus TaxID=196 RepID=A0AAX0HDX1_CAMFE|nr:hypothetical protein [Campylobacter fetus]AJB45751.1 hypothetical protein CR44_05875 [Campylobacter fetus subsp. testudinum]OCR84967.1 hypothetical protein CFT12S05168_07120 [Campylobacter fetus subsp. testudinum]OCR86874.1 hypothetical protein CFT13S00388_07155 [Campylobacter fetus subsp. testudinum]OCR88820.1 hypothetical protein CFT12S00416_05185 [Campylobacter fetus subsp. testudinum]OCR91657.1 hypothetical protein CFT12S02225_00950 [Campylobacter fetus subsp. testudinum]